MFINFLFQLRFKLFLELFVLVPHRHHLRMEVLATLEDSPVVGHESLGLVPFVASVKAMVEKGRAKHHLRERNIELLVAIVKRDTPLNILMLAV